MQKVDFDVAIIGAGPAGAAAALCLPEGISVAHLDRGGPAREKLCSGLLTEEAQRALAAIFGKYNLPPEVAAPPNINVLRYVDFDNNVTMTLPVKYASMHRANFDRWLLSKIKRDGYKTLWGAVVTAVAREDHTFKIDYLLDGEKKSLSARFVIDASGWAAITRGENGFARPVRRFAMQAVFPGGGAKEFRAFFHEGHTDWFGWTVPKEDMVLAGIGFAQEPDTYSGNGSGAQASKAHKRARRAAEKAGHGAPHADGNGAAKQNRLLSFAKFLSMLSEKGWLEVPGLPAPDDLDAIKEFNRIFPVKGSPITTITSIKQVHLG
ncbi:MAG: FAD-dependent monooxygenase, partial [bacterium]